jgi:hypothetical protein
VARQTQSAAVSSSALTAPVTGTFTDASGGQGVFSGTFNAEQFRRRRQKVIATGQLTGTLTDSTGPRSGR